MQNANASLTCCIGFLLEEYRSFNVNLTIIVNIKYNLSVIDPNIPGIIATLQY